MGHGCFTCAISEASLCMFIHSYTTLTGEKDPIGTWAHQNAMETAKYQKALGKIKELKMHCLLTGKFSATCTAV